MNKASVYYLLYYFTADKYKSCETYEYKEDAVKLTKSLANVKDIVNFFYPKITNWLASESLSTPTEQQILAIIIQNYDCLALRLQDNLDQYERYSEKPNYTTFFEEMVTFYFIKSQFG